MSNKKITLMTSGDKGIGKCIVEVLVKEGNRVFYI
jgi:NAD(P)-dependent dehydrogenase (short-subunit alcohol dehydrogenase family)